MAEPQTSSRQAGQPAEPRDVDRPPSPPPSTGWLRSLLAVFGGVVLVAGLAVASWTFVFGLPTPVTREQRVDGGNIFIHGPQVYTRERLVNDRYQEDSWLTGMLEQSTKQGFGYSSTRGAVESSTRRAKTEFGVASAGEASAPPGTPQQRPDASSLAQGLPEIAEQPTFKLQATRAYREQIRTMLIENQLDDRHDLHGNTLYRLRFDATILPNEGSQAGARIAITIEPPDTIHASKKEILDGTAPYQEFEKWLAGWEDVYGRWLTSLEVRLEVESLAWARRYENGRFSPDDYDILINRLRGHILQIAKRIDETPRLLRESRKRAERDGEQPSPFDELATCTEKVFDAAGKKLGELEGELPVADRPDPINVDTDDLKDFRKAFLRGVVERGGEIENHNAHRIYQDRIQELLFLRRTLMALSDTSQCESYLGNIRLGGPVEPAARTQALTPGAPASGPAPVPPPAISDMQALAPPFADMDAGAGRTQPSQFSDSALLRRRLLEAEFWPRIYQAVTGVDEWTDVISDDSLSRAQNTPFTPPSLRPFASMAWNPLRSRRAFQATALTESLTVTDDPACLPAAIFGSSVLVSFQNPTTNQQGSVYVPQTAMSRLYNAAPALKPGPLLAHAKLALAERARQRADLPEQGASANPCDFQVVAIDVPVGLFNFAMRLGKAKDVYTYAISPTEPDELVANRIRSDWVRDFGLQATLSSLKIGTLAGQVGAQEEMAKLLRYDTMQRSVFGYGERIPLPGGGHQALFGWQLLPRDQPNAGDPGRSYLAPKQIPMTALVSLPAWWPRIGLKVTRSWIDRNGRETEIRDAGSQTPPFTIDLPTNFETLDVSLFGNADSGPVLLDWQIPRLVVRSCEPFSVTLMGRRLWRSTVVTLAGERASRVVVMPNMNGIIATFDKAPRPGNLPVFKAETKGPQAVKGALGLKDLALARDDGTPSNGSVSDGRYLAALTVWTSQGFVQLPRLIEIEPLSAPDHTCAKEDDTPAKPMPQQATAPAATAAPATPDR
jgi:hypothetical protein